MGVLFILVRADACLALVRACRVMVGSKAISRLKMAVGGVRELEKTGVR